MERAKEQSERVIIQEVERHSEGVEYWKDWSEEKGDWLEGSLHINGIFNTCYYAWQQLDWPELEAHLGFGIELFKKQNLVKDKAKCKIEL